MNISAPDTREEITARGAALKAKLESMAAELDAAEEKLDAVLLELPKRYPGRREVVAEHRLPDGYADTTTSVNFAPARCEAPGRQRRS